MKRTQVYFPKDLYIKVKAEAQRKGVSVAEVVRSSVAEKVEAKKPKVIINPGNWLLNMVKKAEKISEKENLKGPKDVAARHDDYLAESEIASWDNK